MSQTISKQEQKDKTAGILLNTASAFVFYFATAVVRVHSEISDVSPEMHAFIRYSSGFLSLIIYLSFTDFSFRIKVPKAVIYRSIFNTLAVLCFYRAIVESTAGRANVMNMTYPAFVAALSGPLLKEAPGWKTITALIICMAGIGFHLIDPDTGSISFEQGDVWGLASGILASFAILALRGAAKVTSAREILIWMFGTGSLILFPVVFGQFRLLTAYDALFLLGSAALGVSGQWLLTLSYHKLTAPAGSIISTLRIPIALFFGLVFLSETFYLPAWLGAAFIFGANVLLAIFKRNRE